MLLRAGTKAGRDISFTRPFLFFMASLSFVGVCSQSSMRGSFHHYEEGKRDATPDVICLVLGLLLVAIVAARRRPACTVLHEVNNGKDSDGDET